MELAVENLQQAAPDEPIFERARLSDAFMEMLSYTGFLLELFKTESPDCAQIGRAFAEIVSRAEDRAQLSGYSPAQWRHALFAACALVDELLMCSEWAEKDNWHKHQLQLKHFNTSNAGDEFFNRLAALGDDIAVREVYSLCLSMGFKGKLYSEKDSARLLQIRQENLRAVTGDGTQIPGQLFPKAYPGDRSYRKKKVWNRGFNLLNTILVLLPIAVFAAMFSIYKGILSNLIANFLK